MSAKASAGSEVGQNGDGDEPQRSGRLVAYILLHERTISRMIPSVPRSLFTSSQELVPSI